MKSTCKINTCRAPPPLKDSLLPCFELTRWRDGSSIGFPPPLLSAPYMCSSLAALLRWSRPGCACSHRLVQLSVSLRPVFLSTHSICFAGNRSILRPIDSYPHYSSRGVLFTHASSCAEVFSGQWGMINYSVHWVLISQIWIHELLTLSSHCCEVL